VTDAPVGPNLSRSPVQYQRLSPSRRGILHRAHQQHRRLPLPMFSLPLALFDSMILQIPLSSPFCQETPVLRPALAIASFLILLRRSVGVKQFPTRSAPLSFPLPHCCGHPRSLHPQRSGMSRTRVAKKDEMKGQTRESASRAPALTNRKGKNSTADYRGTLKIGCG